MKLAYFAATVALAAAVPASAQTVKAQDPQSLVDALQEEGFQAKLGTDNAGDPMITSGYSGTTFQIYFYNCTDNASCGTVQFHAGYDLEDAPTLATINEWNRTMRFGRAFLDNENDPIVEMDLDLDDGGVSRALFVDNLEFWTSLLPAFERHIGFRE